jgi:hypothetical protein
MRSPQQNIKLSNILYTVQYISHYCTSLIRYILLHSHREIYLPPRLAAAPHDIATDSTFASLGTEWYSTWTARAADYHFLKNRNIQWKYQKPSNSLYVVRMTHLRSPSRFFRLSSLLLNEPHTPPLQNPPELPSSRTATPLWIIFFVLAQFKSSVTAKVLFDVIRQSISSAWIRDFVSVKKELLSFVVIVVDLGRFHHRSGLRRIILPSLWIHLWHSTGYQMLELCASQFAPLHLGIQDGILPSTSPESRRVHFAVLGISKPGLRSSSFSIRWIAQLLTC